MPQYITAKLLREDRAKLAVSIRQMSDTLHASGAPAFAAEDQTRWEKVNADYDAISKRIDIAERADAVEVAGAAHLGLGNDPHAGRGTIGSDGAQTAGTEEQRAMALQAWCRWQMGEYDLSPQQEAACHAVSLRPERPALKIGLYGTSNLKALQRQYRSLHPSSAVDRMRTDFRAAPMSGQVGATGGYLIAPETLIRNLEINMLAFGGMRQVADILSTSTGERMSWPTADDTSNTGVQLGESANLDNSNAGGPLPSFSKIFWDAYKFSSQAILVPYELLQDSAFDLAALLGEMMGERLGRITNTKYTLGSGANTAKGIVTCAAAGITAASATAIAADEIIRLEHSVDPAYRSGAGYMMHDSILLALRLLKDGQGRYLWQTGFKTGTPDTLNNRPLTVNQDMASAIAASAITVLFGQLSKYKIRRVGEARMYRLEERYRDSDNDGFVTLIREDGNLLTAGTAPVKKLTQAA